ncbi:AzlC family ABC transporter permease [Psychrobacter aestuarii]|nr:AzlC family ABC transporter permease [Psychrobacter aestuarii]
MGYLPAGIAFGVLAQVAGVPLWAIMMLSVVLYAGAAQYACLPMLTAGMPIGSMATNIAAINLRHIFYAMPLMRALPTQRVARTYCLFALTDETFSVLTSLPHSERQQLITPLSFYNHMWWIVASLIGGSIGGALGELIPHLDFALLCLFVILAYEQFASIQRYFPIIIAAMAFIIASSLTEQWVLLLAIGICMLLILLRGMWQPKAAQGDHHEQ